MDLDTSHGVLWSASVPGSLEGFAAGRARVAPQERFGGFLLAEKLSAISTRLPAFWVTCLLFFPSSTSFPIPTNAASSGRKYP